jgi:CHASE2 domain-containing sensor protein
MSIGGYRIVRLLGQGGFCQTYEVEANGTVQVLKVLIKDDYPKAVALFQREARVLGKLSHPGIPKVPKDGYFEATTPAGPIHGLVMEKIPGIDLGQWLDNRQHRPITEALALDWLRQVVEILAQVHRRNYFHRDIKPANIMLKPDGRLVLIDFGGVREITDSYLADQAAGRVASTRLHSRGYAPLEQLDGLAVPQSDFFAVGRTFVHLLSGQAPHQISTEAETGRLLWQPLVPWLLPEFAQLLDELMAPFPGERPPSARAILDRLGEIEASLGLMDDTLLSTWQRGRRWWRSGGGLQRWVAAGLWSGMVVIGVVGLRLAGALQPWELRTLDHLMGLRPLEALDDRLLVITIGEADIQAQDTADMARRGSLADQALDQLLDHLLAAQVAVVGLDIYRDFPVAGDFPRLAQRLAAEPRLVTVCKRADPELGVPGIVSPPESPIPQVGFSDFVVDGDGKLRRQLLFVTPHQGDGCGAAYGFGSQIVWRYLATQGIEPEFIGDRGLRLGDTTVTFLDLPTGGYQQLDASGGQVLLNYRATASGQAAPQVSLMEVLGGQVTAEALRDRIVLIGVTAPSAGDYWPTPLHPSTQTGLAGVQVQAHMVSQLISTALDQRPLLWTWPLGLEILWISGITLGSGIGAVWLKGWRWVSLGIGSLLLGLYGLSWTALLYGGWLPLLPTALASAVASTGIILMNRRHLR